MLLTTVLLCLPGTAFPGQSWLSMIWIDKWVHLALFGMMVLLWCFGLTSRPLDAPRLRQSFFMIAAGALAYGVAMEFVQKNFIPHRGFDLWDIAMNALGSALGLIFCLRYFQRP